MEGMFDFSLLLQIVIAISSPLNAIFPDWITHPNLFLVVMVEVTVVMVKEASTNQGIILAMEIRDRKDITSKIFSQMITQQSSLCTINA